ncbi:MAG: glutamate racemase [Chitinivibrionia bacterium]|nr:glutamate racemase [Chitinivibrionia bacterium]
MKNGAIGVFDSGIGGLTVLKELLARLPGESFVYFGDTARVPYGTKSPETVIRFSRENISFLLDLGVKLVVVACNTASAEALPKLKREYALPMVGVTEPGIRAALAQSNNKRIGIIGTAGTIRSGAYQKGIKSIDPAAEVFAKSCPLFVPLAEEGWVDNEIADLIAREYLREFKERDIDTLVLGCTHYPLLRTVIGRAVGDGVTLVDSAVETAKQVVEVLETNRLFSREHAGEFITYLSDIAPSFREIGERFLGRAIPAIELVSV